MKTKITKATLLSLGFSLGDQEEDEFGQYYKSYEYLGILIVFFRLTGDLLRLDLGSEDRVIDFYNGKIGVRLDYDKRDLNIKNRALTGLKAVDLCRSINVWQIVTFAQLKKAIEVFEKTIDVDYMVGPSDFVPGDRILFENEEGADTGIVTGIDEGYKKVTIRLSGGNTFPTDTYRLTKLPILSIRRLTVCLEEPTKTESFKYV